MPSAPIKAVPRSSSNLAAAIGLHGDAVDVGGEVVEPDARASRVTSSCMLGGVDERGLQIAAMNGPERRAVGGARQGLAERDAQRSRGPTPPDMTRIASGSNDERLRAARAGRARSECALALGES